MGLVGGGVFWWSRAVVGQFKSLDCAFTPQRPITGFWGWWVVFLRVVGGSGGVDGPAGGGVV